MGLNSQTLSVLSYAVLMGIVGIPVWWQTTNVVRFPLPHDRIDAFSQSQIKQPISIALVTDDQPLSSSKCTVDSAIYDINLTTRPRSKEEDSIMSDPTLKVKEMDTKLAENSMMSGGSLTIYDVASVEKLVIGQYQSVFFSSHHKPICQALKSIQETVLGESLLQQMTESIEAPKMGQVNSKWSQIKATPSPDYDILLTLMIPEPHLRTVKWNMRQAVDDYLQPFLDQLKDIYTFSVKSQVLYLTSLGLSATQPMTDAKSGRTGNGIRQEDLGLAINMESKLVSHVSSKPSFNFLAYLPTEAQSPLHIKAAEGTFLDTNAFIVPRWGGVSIWNAPSDRNGTDEETTTANNDAIDERRFMSIVATQLRLLLGLRNDDLSVEESSVVMVPATKGLRGWEKDFLLRMKLFENLMTSRVTLRSLADLLSKISNIVITEEVANEVEVAVSAYESSIRCITSEGQGDLTPCFKHSKTAFVSSERVFFDNSLLELLYFPEDQKYAIYVPLFLPILASFLMVFFPVLKDLKRYFSKKSCKDKRE